jgi:CheY-like chemotaxis protein
MHYGMVHRKVKLDCDGKTSREVMASLLQEFAPPANGRRVVLVVENINRINDSLTRLIRKLLAFFNEREIKASIVDPSGSVAMLYDALGGSVHVEVCGSENEVTTPKEILVVEDTEDSLEFVRTLLEAAGHRVTVARTGNDAIRLAGTRKFDLILLDLVLPDIDGLQVADRLSGSRVPMIAMSAYLDRWAEGDFARVGLGRRLKKPFKISDLLKALRA